jgi:hypothetical protein
MYPAYFKGKTIYVTDRSVIARIRSQLPLLDVSDTRDQIIGYASKFQTPLAKAYRELIKLGII